jgi:hypothetical protein
MKLVCINNIHNEDRLSVGKIYDFIKMTDGEDSAYLMTDDNGDSWPFTFSGPNKFSVDRWISLDEWREDKLKELGI